MALYDLMLGDGHTGQILPHYILSHFIHAYFYPESKVTF